MGGSFHHGSGHIHHSSSSSSHGGHGGSSKQQTITIHDTPSPTAVITISDSEDETPDVKKASSSKHHASTSMCGRSANQCRTSGGASCSAAAIKPSSSSSNIHHSSSSSSLAAAAAGSAMQSSLPAVVTSGSSSNSLHHHSSQYHSLQQQQQQQPPHQPQQQHHTSVISSGSQAGICGASGNNTGTLSGRSRKSTAVASTSTTCVTVGDSDGENDRRNTPKHQAIKYEHHAGQSQKKRLLAMAQNECLLSTTNHTLHVPKQEPTEFVAYEYPQVDKRSSWAPPSASSSHYSSGHKRESSVYMPSSSSSSAAAAAAAAAAANQSMNQSNMGVPTVVAAPPHAHAKNTPTGSGGSSSWGAPVYRQHQPSSNTPLGSSPGALLPQQDIYAAQGDIYRRSAVFVSQAPYQTYNRVVPPPAHNASSRQVLPAHPLPAHIQFPTQYSQFGPLSPAQIANKHYAWFGE